MCLVSTIPRFEIGKILSNEFYVQLNRQSYRLLLVRTCSGAYCTTFYAPFVEIFVRNARSFSPTVAVRDDGVQTNIRPNTSHCIHVYIT
jgi:hypothetical protein